MRKLATIRRIDEIRAIPDADAIMCAVIGGWTVVIRKDEFKVGDLAVYLEIDSWVPHELAPFLSKGKEPREYEGVKGERLRTVRLRGQLSQGLLLPITHEIEVGWSHTFFNFEGVRPMVEGDDLTDVLGIKKWEAPIPAELAGNVAGLFPSYIPKTDQERIQNLTTEFYKSWTLNPLRWEVTEKLDGSSVTIFLNTEDHFGVCSRNWELLESNTNSLWKVAREADLETKLRDRKLHVALQGELIGPGVQANRYQLKKHGFYLFDVYNIDEKRYLNSFERVALASDLGIEHVPVLGLRKFTTEDSVDKLLLEAEAKSKLNEATEREGLVFKCVDDADLSFKAISNKFLLRGGD